MTTTEGLAEIKTILKRVERKREFVLQHLHRASVLADPLAIDGGSADAIARELQAIRDLEARLVSIRLAIQSANEATSVTAGVQTRTMAEWLVWRREVAPAYKEFLASITRSIGSARAEAARNAVRANAQAVNPDQDVIVHVNETRLHAEIENIEEVLGELDGQLSLKNATVELVFGTVPLATAVRVMNGE